MASVLAAHICARTPGQLMRAAWPRHTAKLAARAAAAPVATAKRWVTDKATPSATTMLRMARECERLRGELLRELGGHGAGVVALADDAAGARVLAAGGLVEAAGGEAPQPQVPGAVTR